MSHPIGYLPPPKEAPARPLPRPIAVQRPRTKAEREAAAWIESVNPLRGLTVQHAQMIFDAARRGNDVRLQWLYANMEQSDPTLLICAERRASALVDLGWTVHPKAAGRVRGFDETLAREQCAAVEAAFGQAEENNLLPAIEHLATAFFRGHAHLLPLWSPDGLILRGFDPLDAWNVCRDLLTGAWHWNPSASETLDFRTLEPIPPGELVTLVRPRHIDYPAMAIYLRAALGEKAWGQFLERYGVPPVIITMPPDIDPSRVEEYRQAAEKVADGGVGALPYASTVTYATEARGTNPFKEFLEHQQQLVVLMATGGMLTSLTGATGIGQGATQAHEETWRTIVRRDAGLIATALNRTVTDPLLDRAFPSRPHLAAFDFETDPSPTPAEIFDLAAKAVAAGYQVTKQELEERTGYTLESRTEAPLQPLPTQSLPGLAWNRAPTEPARPVEAAPTAALQSLAKALQLDLTPAADALQTLLKDPSPQAAQALIARLPELLPQDPEMAAILEEELTKTFGDTLAAEPAPPDPSRPVAPRLRDEPTVANSEGECHAKDPANCPYHGTGKYAGEGDTKKPAETRGTTPAPKATPAPKVELPPSPNPKASAADYRKANRTRGEAALKTILETHADVPAAMISRKLGPIDFVWGKAFTHETGYGFAHIIEKHGEAAAKRVPEILAHGKYFHDERRPNEFLVVYQGTVVSLKQRSDNFYVVSSYDDAKKATAYIRRGGQVENKAEGEGATC